MPDMHIGYSRGDSKQHAMASREVIASACPDPQPIVRVRRFGRSETAVIFSVAL
jgi:hypothetical protein